MLFFPRDRRDEGRPRGVAVAEGAVDAIRDTIVTGRFTGDLVVPFELEPGRPREDEMDTLSISLRSPRMVRFRAELVLDPAEVEGVRIDFGLANNDGCLIFDGMGNLDEVAVSRGAAYLAEGGDISFTMLTDESRMISSDSKMGCPGEQMYPRRDVD